MVIEVKQPIKSTKVLRTMTVSERFWDKVNKDGPIPEARPELGPCWEWLAGLSDKGYGQFAYIQPDGRNRKIMAHTFAYEEVNGPIPKGLIPDHLCRNRACVNPTHVEPVTFYENNLRARIASNRNRVIGGLCKRGHLLTEENAYVRRDQIQCRTCINMIQREKRRKANPNLRPPRQRYRVIGSVCKYGHPLVGSNIRIDRGRVECCICRKEWNRRSGQKRRNEKRAWPPHDFSRKLEVPEALKDTVVALLIEKQKELQLSDDRFAQTIAVSGTWWNLIRRNLLPLTERMLRRITCYVSE